jgi:DNA-binding response OmpR family regulator
MDQSVKILIIDDDEHILAILSDFLKSKDYDVITASDGFEGLKLFENYPQGFNLIITDIVMPQISGTGLISIFSDLRQSRRIVCEPLKAVIKP